MEEEYRVSVTPEEYLLATSFNGIETTAKEKEAPIFSHTDAKKVLKTLARMGYDALLVKA